MEFNQKITESHLKRRAVLYIRQSTMKQVFENSESTIRQYALKDRLVTLGWAERSITIIDCDLGRSGADADGREGFKQLVADVGSGEAGAVACIECSRLSRNSHDWGRLMEICAITKAVLIDADGVYDPNDFNDRILLGLKGTISEAELHFIRARMDGGRINKAQRGEFRTKLPVGYVYDGAGRVVMDSNADVRSAVNLLFDTFRRIGTANGTAEFFEERGYKYPVDTGCGFGNGGIQWKSMTAEKVCQILRNPTYAGIYSYGKKRREHTIDGKKVKNAPEDEWHVRLEGHHDGYIGIDEFYGNIAKMKANNSKQSGSPPREGSALLQGIAVCGVCGLKMYPQYHVSKNGKETPYYSCYANGWRGSEGGCQSVHGSALDIAVANMILDELTPLAIKNAVEVEQEANRRKEASDNYFLMQIERARYEVDLAKKRYMSVDPSNRLVAFELERLWNEKIIELSQAEEELNRHNRKKSEARLNNPASTELNDLADNLKKTWHTDGTRVQDKKRILRCLLEDVTITKGDSVTTLGVLFKTGATRVIECENPKLRYVERTTDPKVLDFISEKSTVYTTSEIAKMLNQNNLKTGADGYFSAQKVYQLMRNYSIPTLGNQLREKGYIGTKEKAALLGITQSQLGELRRKGALGCDWIAVDGKSSFLYAPS
jgi:DNA invertase Pin-like site-specific DNA recombinase